MKNPKKLISFMMGSSIMTCLVLFLQACSSTPPPVDSELHRLQGYWESDGPADRTSITIRGDSLHFFKRADFWFEAAFTLPTGADPRQLHATITGSSPPTDNIGVVILAIFKIEDETLTLATDGSSDAPPTTFEDATNIYVLKKVECQ